MEVIRRDAERKKNAGDDGGNPPRCNIEESDAGKDYENPPRPGER